MSTQVTPQTPATTPAKPEKPKSMREALDRIAAKDVVPVEAKPVVEQATPQTPAAETKRLLHLKLIDNKEEDFDLDEHYADEAKRTEMTATLQKGRNYERAVERAAREKFLEGQRAIASDLVKRGFKFAPKIPNPVTLDDYDVIPPAPATTPAPGSADPLTTEAATLQAKAEAGEATAADLARLSKVNSELAVREWTKAQDAKQAEAAQERDRSQRYERGKTWLNAEIEKLVGARTKSFDGRVSPSRLARLRQTAFAAGEAAALRDENPVVAAKAVIDEEANDLDAMETKWRASLPNTPQSPASAPVIGSAPAGGGGSNKPKDMNEALDRILPGWRKGG